MTTQHSEATEPLGRIRSIVCRPSVAAFVATCLLMKAVLTFAVFESGFLAFGGDDIGKLIVAIDTANSPRFAPSRTWLPLQFWILALGYRATDDVYVASLWLNGFCSLATSGAVFLFARYLFKEFIARLTLLFAIFSPWHVWTGIAGQGEALFQCLFLSTAYSLIRWQREGERKWLILAVAASCVLACVRYQGWIVSLVVTGYLFAIVIRVLPSIPRLSFKVLIPFTAIVFFFPIVWLTYHAMVFGDAFHWLPDTSGDDRVVLPIWLQLVRFPLYVVLTAPLISPLLLYGMRGVRLLSRHEAIPYVAFTYGYLLVLVGFGLLARSEYVEQRYVIAPLLATLPLSAWAIVNVPIARSVRLAYFCLICIWGVASSFHVTRHLAVEFGIAKRLAPVLEQQSPGDKENIFVHIRQNEQLEYRTDVRAIGVWSGDPFRFLGHTELITKQFEAAMLASADAARQFFDKNSIQIVLTDSPQAIARLDGIWEYKGSLFGYKVYCEPHSITPPWLAPAGTRLANVAVQSWQNHLELRGLTPSDANFPRFVIADWWLPEGFIGPLRARWEFVPTGSSGQPFEIRSTVGGGVTRLDNHGVAISDRVVIGGHRAPVVHDGRYRLYLSISDQANRMVPLQFSVGHGNGPRDPRCDLGSINIVRSKTRFLRNVATGEERDALLTLYVVLSLLN